MRPQMGSRPRGIGDAAPYNHPHGACRGDTVRPQGRNPPHRRGAFHMRPQTGSCPRGVGDAAHPHSTCRGDHWSPANLRRAFLINLPAQTNHPSAPAHFSFPTRPNKSCPLRRATSAQKCRHNSTYSVQMHKKSRCILQSCTALTVRIYNIMRLKYSKLPKMKRFNAGT